MSTLSTTAKDVSGLDVDAVVILVAAADPPRPLCADALAAALAPQLKPMGVTGAVDTVTRMPAPASLNASVVVLAGVGPLHDGVADPEQVRRAAGAATASLAGVAKVAVVAPAGREAEAGEGALFGAYSFTQYRAKGKSAPKAVETIRLVTPAGRDKAVKSAGARAQILAAAIHGTRDLVNTPPLDLFPAEFADRAVALAKQAGLAVSVLDDEQLRRQGYGGLTAVGQGSSRGPRLVRLDWRGPATGPLARRSSAKLPHVALVGKGITFDSGGLSIKPAAGMEAMKSDMAGAAAVLHTLVAVAALKLPVHVTGWLCIAENMPSGSAQRPSDVITIYGGRTVEVLNTDAEGRLVLADGLVAAGEENPDLIVDVATLTGAQTIALGNRVSALMSNDDALRDRIFRLATAAGEQFWPMPLPPELRPGLDSAVADIANMGERFGGMLVAGLFLQEFVPDRTDGSGQIPWAHLDIAGPAMNNAKPWGYTPKGGTGVAVRTLVALAEDLAASS